MGGSVGRATGQPPRVGQGTARSPRGGGSGATTAAPEPREEAGEPLARAASVHPRQAVCGQLPRPSQAARLPLHPPRPCPRSEGAPSRIAAGKTFVPSTRPSQAPQPFHLDSLDGVDRIGAHPSESSPPHPSYPIQLIKIIETVRAGSLVFSGRPLPLWSTRRTERTCVATERQTEHSWSPPPWPQETRQQMRS